MSSIDASVQQFINHPESYHLESAGGIIRAIGGRSDADETVHQIALEALKTLALTQQSSQAGVASTSFDPSADVNACQKAEFIYKINKWASEGHADEKRAEAAKRIIDAYVSKTTCLDLSILHLRSLPSEIGNLSKLTRLILINNNLATLPDSIGNLSKLEDLFLNNNHLVSLPDSIGNLCELLILYLDHNNLATLPNAMSNLSKLENLFLSNNNLATLPDWIGNLCKLWILHLDHNNLATLPDSIDNLSKLENLELNNNNFATLPEWIGNFSKLTSLYLHHNNLTTLPDSIKNLTRLNIIVFRNNPIVTGRTENQVIASYPFLLRLPQYRDTLTNLPDRQAICRINGLPLEYIPHDMQTAAVVLSALTQNPASIAFARADLITYELAKQAVTINPTLARFIPDALIDIPTVLGEIEENPCLLSLLFKIVPSVKELEELLSKDKAKGIIQGAISHDYRTLYSIPPADQVTDFGEELIMEALRINPNAYTYIAPDIFNPTMLHVLIESHKDKEHNAALYSILQNLLVKIDVEDPDTRSHYFPIADELAHFYPDDPMIMGFLIAKYGKTLADASDDLRGDYDFVFTVIHNHPDEIRFCLVRDQAQQRILQEYAEARKRQLGR